MDYSPSRIVELVRAVPWRPDARLRLFWVRCPQGSRDDLATALKISIGSESVVPIVLRSAAFGNANAVLSDVLELFEANRAALEALAESAPDQLTVLVLARDEFRLVQASSPITLPAWFPICAGKDTSFLISDLAHTAEVKPVNCPETRLAHVAELVFRLEEALVDALGQIERSDPIRLVGVVQVLMPSADIDVAGAVAALRQFEAHIAASTSEPRAYRPNAADGSKFLGARMLRLTLNSSPKQLANTAANLASGFNDNGTRVLKQPFFGIFWRPAAPMAERVVNWHSILAGYFEAYQLINAASHAGDFPAFPVALQYAHSLDLRRFLHEATEHVRGLHDHHSAEFCTAVRYDES